MPPHDEDALTPLVDDNERTTSNISNDNSTNNNRNTTKRGVIFNRILILLILVGAVAASVFFQSESVQLTQQLAADEVRIHELEQTLEAQQGIIQRFNNSVTNSDVLAKLDGMYRSMEAIQQDISNQLETTNHQVSEKLNMTLQTLDQTVKTAEAQISSEVELVKKNFEQYARETQDQFSMENNFMVYQLAGTFTLLSCLISMWHMTAHMRKLREPVIQRKILAILWMSPIYAITSWFSLVFTSAEGYFAIIKDAYEAYVIYQFLSFCISVLGKGDRNTVVDLLAKHADHLTPPFRLFPCFKKDPYEDNRALADAVLFQCQYFAMQFVFLRPLTTIANVEFNRYQYYGPWGATGPNDYRAPQFYVMLIQNLSIFTAFTGLLKFYHAVDAELAWCRPFAKFLCIKGVVFMTFWQGLAITVLAETTDVGGANAEEWARSAQNFLICLEMLCFSIAHFYCFPTDEWEPNYKALHSKKAGLSDSIAFGDFVDDLKLFKRFLVRSKSKKKKVSTPSTVPEECDDQIMDEEYGSRTDSFTNDDEDDDDVDDTVGTRSVSSSSAGGPTDSGDSLGHGMLQRQYESGEFQEVSNRLLNSDFLNENSTLMESGERSEGVARIPNQESEVSERSGLLSNNRSEEEEEEELLRPSIFTTLANPKRFG